MYKGKYSLGVHGRWPFAALKNNRINLGFWETAHLPLP